MRKEIIEFNKKQRGSKNLDFQAGDVVRVHLKIKEAGKERIQIFEGIIIAIKGRQSSSPTITVRKVSHGIGVEMIIPVLSKNVSRIELVKKAKVRRAKLYYIRDLTTKQSRMKYKDIQEFIKEETAEVPAAEEIKEDKLEEVVADADKKE